MRVGWNWVLVLAGALLILIEVALGGFAGFDLVLIGSAILLGGAVGLLVGSPATGFIIAAAASLLYVAAGRRWVRARIRGRHVPSNVDALVGIQGLVTLRVAEHAPGQVRVKDETWRAVPAPGAGPFEPGAVVTVAGIDGVTLQVR
ncbi:MAG TPA: NfeD family protein [Candidatus Eisenbacteria bacterium]|jgi:membrane protein implicated in regulation of membrane protease activity